MPNDLYDRMTKAGVNMSWYDRAKKKQQPSEKKLAPLGTERCSILSIYLLKTNGRLFTVTSSGKTYEQVRRTMRKPKADKYICLHCKGTFDTYEKARKHIPS